MGNLSRAMTIEVIARACHEANRGFSRALGDLSHVAWEDTPEDLRASVRNGVALKLDHPETTPEQSHQAWLEYKGKQGWGYGQVKDPAAKTHPCFLPYGLLPPEQRAKDAIFTAIVAALTNQDPLPVTAPPPPDAPADPKAKE